ncbi:hypothetical protein [Dactylosporangium sp. CA-139066]|uniref:hypothetical protein n=1 Tax=Dactylosporangium sp. CA-139066 TaxID=3239930 RepID=UPI003D8B5AEE
MDGRRNFNPEPDADSRWYPDDRGYDDRGYEDRRDDRARSDRDWESRGRDDADRGYGDERGYAEDRGYTPTRYADEREYDDGYRVPEPRGAGRGYGADALSYGEGPGGSYGEAPSGQFGAQGGAGRGVDPGDLSGEFGGGRSRRSEAIDRSALQRPVSGGAGGGAPAGAGLSTSGAPIPGLPPQGGVQAPSLAGQGLPGPGLAGQGAPGQGVPGQGVPGQGAAVAGMTGAGLGGAATSPLGGGAGPVSGGPVSGAPASGGPGAGAQNAFAAPTALTAAVPAPQQYGAGDPGGAVYRSKRPGLAVVLVLLTILFEVPVLRLFLSAMTAKEIPAGGTLASIFMIPALPMFALGLYGLIGGAAAAAPGARAWLRTPLAYLPVALLLFLAAGLAAS